MSSVKKTAVIITIISLICKLFGFGREIILAYFFGTSFAVDAYLMAISMPSIIFGWLASSSVVFTPIYTDIKNNSGTKKSKEFVSNLLSIVFLISILCVVIGVIFDNQIVALTAPGFEGETFDLTVSYFNVSILLVVLMAPAQILASYLNCNDKFIQSNLSNLMFSGVQLIIIFIAGFLGNYLLIYGVLLSNILHLIIIHVFSIKNGLRLTFNAKITPEIKQVIKIIIPVFMSSMIMQINTFIDKSFASGLAEGSIAALNYSNTLKSFIFIIFTIAITTMIYPMLSQVVAEKDMDKFKYIFSQGISITIILFIPLTVGSIVLAEPAVSFVFERGEFDSSSTMMTTSAFVMYSIGLTAVALRDIVTRVFYSMQDTKSTLYIGALAVGLNILFNFILVDIMGHSGLALATSISAILSLPLFFVVLRKKIGALGLKNTVILLVKSCISSAVMGVIVYFLYNYLATVLSVGSIGILLSIGISVAVGGSVYFVVMIFLRVKEMELFTDSIKKILSREW